MLLPSSQRGLLTGHGTSAPPFPEQMLTHIKTAVGDTINTGGEICERKPKEPKTLVSITRVCSARRTKPVQLQRTHPLVSF